jgi:hypothetical protein
LVERASSANRAIAWWPPGSPGKVEHAATGGVATPQDLGKKLSFDRLWLKDDKTSRISKILIS